MSWLVICKPKPYHGCNRSHNWVRPWMSAKKAAQWIAGADALVITAGAGMGVDSGLPDFRGDSGFWKAYPALHGTSFVSMASPRWFNSDPHRAWGFYGHRLNLYRSVTPHDGFDILRQWSIENNQAFVFASNVDGQFQNQVSQVSRCLSVVAPFTMFKILRAWMAFGLQMRLLSMWMKSHYRPEIRCLDTRQAKRSFDQIFSCLEMAAGIRLEPAHRRIGTLHGSMPIKIARYESLGRGWHLPTVRRARISRLSVECVSHSH